MTLAHDIHVQFGGEAGREWEGGLKTPLYFWGWGLVFFEKGHNI
jgi:hypothetical protein